MFAKTELSNQSEHVLFVSVWAEQKKENSSLFKFGNRENQWGLIIVNLRILFFLNLKNIEVQQGVF